MSCRQVVVLVQRHLAQRLLETPYPRYRRPDHHGERDHQRDQRSHHETAAAPAAHGPHARRLDPAGRHACRSRRLPILHS
jgi:hypothetical protein